MSVKTNRVIINYKYFLNLKSIIKGVMDIYADWKFIAEIPPNAKPCFYDKTFFYVNEWFLTLKRRWKGEKGERGILYVENLIVSTKTLYKKLQTDKNISQIQDLKILMKSAIPGLENLVITYRNDYQNTVAESYEKCIKEINVIVSTKRTGFFNSQPKLI